MKYNKKKNKNFFIYGYHSIKESLNSKNIKILIVYIQHYKTKKKKYKRLLEKIIKKKISYKILYNKKIIKTNNKKKENFLALVSYIKNFNFNFFLNKKKKILILILFYLTDIKNIGSIIRSALCFNVDLIIIKKNFNIFNPKIIKISSGAILKIPIYKINNLESTINFLKKKKIKIFSITEKGKDNIINNINKKNFSIALILGNEEKGISKNILNISDKKIFIPINKKKISSLNVSIACIIILYEIYKITITN
ncbi:MAG: 23S rRNA (guanosine(2251)-2'-O)-methyltransferase RlmB [Candidatus Shikimatogenerans sp. JK-2022]|nr:23S rRNA (guanosine(2251)-2'-O)-methyltransferase RlmB [Candidatus Shikimatogenerans bostrichidophilus]